MKHFLPNILITFIAGCLYALAYPTAFGNGWFPLLFLALPLFLWKLEEANFKQSLILILTFNMGLNVTGYYWIPHTLREFGELPYIVSVILGAFFALILQPHWWFYAIWKKFRPSWNWKAEHGILLTAFVMTLLERYIPQQFPSFAGSPWLHLAPYLGLAPILGVVGFSLVTYWVSLEAVSQLKNKKFRPQVWIVLVVFTLANALMPLKPSPSEKNLSVRVVQANVGNFLKVSSEKGDANSYQSIIKNYFKLSTSDEFKPELIIWPETAYPNTFYGEETRLDPLFTDIMNATGAEILIGGYDQDLTKSPGEFIESVFNSSILMSNGGFKTSYHKNILIPFGETLPFGPLNKSIVDIVPTISLFARGDGTPLMETRDGLRFVTPICYELLESNYMRSLLNQWKGNHFIVNHTNDSWYGDTAEPYQHLFLGKWRALEFQLPIIRSTNTGITSVIFADGSESKRLGINETANLDLVVPLGNGSETPYQLYGAFPVLGIFAIFFLLTWWREKTGSRP
mgnify:CR=1 FL=1